MKNFLRIALVVAVVLCLAIAMVACGGDDTKTTTTAGKTTTAGTPADTTTPGAVVTTTPGVVTTTVVTTTLPETTTTEAPGLFLTPSLTIDGVARNDVWFFESWGTWALTDDGEITTVVGAALAELVGVEFRKGTIEVRMTMNEDATTTRTGDSGFMFALSEPFDPDMPYYFEGGASYYFALVSDSQGFGVSRVYYEGGAWHWMPNEAGVDVVAGPFYEDGGDVTIKIDTDGESYIDCYINGNLISEIPIPEGQNLFTYRGTDNCKVGLRAEGVGLVYHEITITNVD
jgi:hypothetical protein